ncbi:DNA cytosine methyltransferase [Novosphingobium sediminicola]|uniref:Cytosine-specific methyltransferase n=1 Tax=Novosphingobium sediminicola TaxID=563162 RepID=A0A7W6G7G0_9SPHN|nr:DNA (cytosine-5-)-methyltransferase [Novosphingobium sediminicola]MBB3956874.1 site-specific DNA-cytosine methylase [Novosphingobium sediminicola]
MPPTTTGATLTYGSVCSGIEAASVAWHPLGWRAAFYSEIEPFPRAVLAHHYPDVPCHGDFTTIGADDYGPIDLLVGGTPCQSFSIGGLRKGLDDSRGILALEYCRLADRKRPRWLVWENVPGALSTDRGRAFGSIVGALAELGYGWAYRILDAQHFGVPQQRPRLILVGYLGNAGAPIAVLFERESFARRSAKRSKEVVSVCITRRGPGSLDDRETYIVEGQTPRHMTPVEVERCFGFRDGYTHVPYRGKPAADGPRYKALGNSMAVPVMAWIGQRIQMVEDLTKEQQEAA